MFTKIALRLSGLDLRDSQAYAQIPEDLSYLGFEANGGVSSAVFVTEDPHPIGPALDAARCIAKHIPGARVVEVYDELVSISDIAARCEIGAEAVRLWVNGRRRTTRRPFPAPRQVVGHGAKPMSLWAWREVLGWTRDVVGIDADEDVSYLDDVQLAELNAELSAMGSPVETKDWRPLGASSISLAVRTESVRISPTVGAILEHIDEALYGERITTRTPAKRAGTR